VRWRSAETHLASAGVGGDDADEGQVDRFAQRRGEAELLHRIHFVSHGPGIRAQLQQFFGRQPVDGAERTVCQQGVQHHQVGAGTEVIHRLETEHCAVYQLDRRPEPVGRPQVVDGLDTDAFVTVEDVAHPYDRDITPVLPEHTYTRRPRW